MSTRKNRKQRFNKKKFEPTAAAFSLSDLQDYDLSYVDIEWFGEQRQLFFKSAAADEVVLLHDPEIYKDLNKLKEVICQILAACVVEPNLGEPIADADTWMKTDYELIFELLAAITGIKLGVTNEPTEDKTNETSDKTNGAEKTIGTTELTTEQPDPNL